MSWNEYVVGLQGNRRKVMVCLNIRTSIFLCFVSSYCGLVRDFVRRYKPEKLPFYGFLGLLFSLSVSLILMTRIFLMLPHCVAQS